MHQYLAVILRHLYYCKISLIVLVPGIQSLPQAVLFDALLEIFFQIERVVLNLKSNIEKIRKRKMTKREILSRISSFVTPLETIPKSTDDVKFRRDD